MRRVSLVLMLSTAACGVPQEEHDKALGDQKAAFDAALKKQQEASAAELSAQQSDATTTLKKRDNHIGELSSEVKRLGGNLAEVRAKADDLNSKLGATSEALAHTKKSLATTQKDLSETGAALSATQTELEQVRQLRKKAEAVAAAFENVATKLKAMVDTGKLEVAMRKGRMTLKLPDNILFSTGRTGLKKAGREALKSVAEVLKTVEERDFVIAGHTDNVPIKGGRYKSNWDLSTARAVSVVKLMIDAGVPATRLAAAGFGEFDPVGDNKTPEGRAQNRRLEIILMPKLDELPQLPMKK
jgi:chemotaxis protein MotB